MALDSKEDKTEPFSEEQLISYANYDSNNKIIVQKVLNPLNEKRDAYNGIISSMIYVIRLNKPSMLDSLKKGLSNYITSNPMRYGGKVFFSKALIRLTAEQPQFVIDFFEGIIESSEQWKTNFRLDSEVLRVQIKALKAIKQAEQVDKAQPTNLPQDRIDKICAAAIFSCDDSTKIDTLSLVLESRSTTKPLSDKELNLFKVLFQDALSVQEPALRQNLLALTNKTLKRVKESHRVVIRDKKEYTDEQRDLIHKNYMQFLSWLIEFCFESIYCNAYFGSFLLTITTLKLIIQHVTFDDASLDIEPLFYNKRCYDSILGCLNDSFEDNKKLALELLFMLPQKQEFYCQKNLDCFESIAYHLVGSVNPAHSLTCQYVFKLVIGLASKQSDDKHSKNQHLLLHLNRLTDMVEVGLRETNEDFVVALKQKPIYPKLSCIRALLSEININAINSDDREDWQNLAKRIVANSIAACQSVSEIVCNLNPETIGHLPMDLKPVDVETLSETLKVSIKISDSKLNMISSQMLLISGWKTIKECSLALGAMVTLFWWPKQKIKSKLEKNRGLDMAPILDHADIKKILDFFDHYLKNLRHRGAFEQAYNGFIMVTKRIWHDEDLRNMLTESLNEIMSDFKNEALDDQRAERLKAYVTRRSAGLPFYVQAILQSEHKQESKTLRSVMDDLFEILESDKAEEYQRIHSLNILRALIKEHTLGEKVLTYLGRTFAITLDAFKSDSYSIRNCASMLLKSAVDRAFGVNRLRGEIHRRNQLSYEKFFTECPDLQHKILAHLTEASTNRSKDSLATVHAIFIILFRLRSTLNPKPVFNEEKILWPLRNPMYQLTINSPDFRISELAAKLVARIEDIFRGDEHRAHIRNFEETFYTGNYQSSTTVAAVNLTRGWIENSKMDRSLFMRITFARIEVERILGRHVDAATVLAFDVASDCCLKLQNVSNVPTGLKIHEWLPNLIPSILPRLSLNPTVSNHTYESLIFKLITTVFMCCLQNYSILPKKLDDVKPPPNFQDITNLLIENLIRQPDRRSGINLQSSLIRFIRQILNESNDFVEDLIGKLDIDCTAAHITPYDRLMQMDEHDSKRDQLAKHCEQPYLREYIKLMCQDPTNPIGSALRNFELYKEFIPIENSVSKARFIPKVSNNTRSLELMAFACKYCSAFNFHKTIRFPQLGGEDGFDSKLNYLTHFISDLPDCDIKCLALLLAGELLACELDERQTLGSDTQLPSIENFSKIVDEMADGDRSLTIRETCSRVLQLILKKIVKCEDAKLKHLCLMNLFSALIKLSQDEERQIRESCQLIIVSLRDCAKGLESCNGQLIVGSRLNHLIKVIATDLFTSNTDHDANNCFELLMRIIFNHAKNYSNDVNEAKERLFDKTKLNTFADHVATIQSALEGLQVFFNKRNLDNTVELDSLKFPEEIVTELRIVDCPLDDGTGDYSWRLKKVAEGLTNGKSECNKTNSQIVDIFLESLDESLDYFSKDYRNMLIDTEYTYRELSLFKRIAFIKFVLSCTKHQLKNEELISKIREKLTMIATSSCCTTLLYKCYKLMVI